MAALLSGLLSCAGAEPQVALKHAEKRATLPNGLKLVVMPVKSTNLVQVDVRYHVGAKEDYPGKAGLAHLVEHMMFQHRFGSPDVPIEERLPTFQVLPQIALPPPVGYNASTNWDTTHYWLRAPKEDVENLLRLESLRMVTGCETIPEEQFERERDVVRNEIRQRLGTPEGQVLYEALRSVYPEGHAYREMIGGNDQQLASIEFEDVCRFMSEYYTPMNATLLVTGNVDPDEIGVMAMKYFADIEPRKPAAKKEVDAVELKYERLEIAADIERDTINIMWALPSQATDEYRAAMQMLSSVGRNMRRFAREWQLGRVSGPELLGGAYAPMAVLQIELYKGASVDEALDFAWKAVDKSRREAGILLEGPDYNVEVVSKRLYKYSLIEAAEALEVRASMVANLLQFQPDKIDFDGGGEYFLTVLDDVDKLDWSEYESFVKRTLDKKRAVVLVAKASAEGIKGDERAGLKFQASAHDERPLPPVDPAEANVALIAPKSDSILKTAERYQLKNGMEVVLLPFDGLPIVQANLVFAVGSSHEPASMAGLSDVAASFLEPPAGNAYLETGVSLRGFGGMDSSTFVARGMSIYLDVILKGLERTIVTGSISQDHVESYRDDYKKMFERESYQRQRTFNLEMDTAIYGATHPYTTNGQPTPKTLEKVGRDAAMRFVREQFTAKNATLFVVGNFESKQARKFIQDNFGNWPGGHAAKPVAIATPDRSGPVYFGVADRDEAPQVAVSMAYPAPAGVDSQEAARMVLVAMLNKRMGQVRSQLGSSYGMGADRIASVGPTAYRMGGSADALRAGETLRFIRDQIQGLRDGIDFDRDFAEARREVMRTILAENTATSALASRLSTIDRFDLARDHYDTLLRQVATVTPPQVKALLAAELDPSKEIIGLMGPREAISKGFAAAGIEENSVRIIEPAAP